MPLSDSILSRLGPSVSVIVVNWNGRHFLTDCLESLRRQTCQDFETILVDNGSIDGSVDFVRQRFPEVQVLAQPQNLGFGEANRIGYEQAKGSKLIILLNNDTEVHPNWVQALLDAEAEYPDAGSFACKMLAFNDRKTIDNYGFYMTGAGAVVEDHNVLDGEQFSRPRFVFGACGGAAAYRPAMLGQVGFFDRDIFMTYEDVELAFRAQLMGWKCVSIPGAIVYHYFHGTMKHYSERQVYYSQRHVELLYFKNMPFALIVLYAPLRLVYEIGACAYFVRIHQGRAFLRAKLSALRSLPKWLSDRRRIQARRVVSVWQLRSQFKKGWIRSRIRKTLGLSEIASGTPVRPPLVEGKSALPRPYTPSDTSSVS